MTTYATYLASGQSHTSCGIAGKNITPLIHMVTVKVPSVTE